MEDIRVVDLLNREKFIKDAIVLIDTLSQGKKSASFAINGKWGVGKSFILDRLEEQLDERYLIFRYNAWENDFYDEPLMAILSSFAEQLNEFNAVENTVKGTLKTVVDSVKNALIGLMGKVSKTKLGFNVIDVMQTVKNAKKTQEIDTKFDEKSTINFVKKEIRNNLEKLSREITIIVMVDELDRCLPEYAIKTLERLHHLFDEVFNLQTIIAIDKDQLVCTVKKIFGQKEEDYTDEKVDNYLKKFIDFQLTLDEGQVDKEVFDLKFSEYSSKFEYTQLSGTNEEDVKSFRDKILDNMDIRTRILIVEKAMLIHDMLLSRENKYDYIYQCVELMLVVAFNNKCEMVDKIATDYVLNNALNTFIFKIPSFSFIVQKIKDPYEQVYSGHQIRENSVVINANKFYGKIWTVSCSLYQYDNYKIPYQYSANDNGGFMKPLINYARDFAIWLKTID